LDRIDAAALVNVPKWYNSLSFAVQSFGIA
jgi:hypothetical protein